MPTQAQRSARTHLMYELEHLQEGLAESWLDQSLPDDWTGLDWYAQVDRHKTRVTLRLDSDMLRWFRKLGPGYQARINRVLRIYWMALLAGQIKGYPQDDTLPRLMVAARDLQAEFEAERGESGA